MRLELTQDRGHVHVALAAVVAIEVLESGVLCLHCASGSTFFVRGDEERILAEWSRLRSIPMPLRLPPPERATPARPVRPRRVVVVEADG